MYCGLVGFLFFRLGCSFRWILLSLLGLVYFSQVNATICTAGVTDGHFEICSVIVPVGLCIRRLIGYNCFYTLFLLIGFYKSASDVATSPCAFSVLPGAANCVEYVGKSLTQSLITGNNLFYSWWQYNSSCCRDESRFLLWWSRFIFRSYRHCHGFNRKYVRQWRGYWPDSSYHDFRFGLYELVLLFSLNLTYFTTVSTCMDQEQ